MLIERGEMHSKGAIDAVLALTLQARDLAAFDTAR
jgi:hypothetical protein